ncbi:MAG: metal-dependent transcriptional regulator [Acutalibacteraceae bacterium]
MHIQESGEMYLETIYILSEKTGAVRSIDVGEYMGYSKPSVSRAVGILKKGGYLLMDKDGYLTLTESGLAVAKKIYERHTLLTDFLIRLGVNEKTAVEDACKIEHDISDETFDALKKHAKLHSPTA